MNIKNKIDLHIHTKLSDGTDMPEELLELVKEAGIGVFSVTDHDTVRSVKLIRGLLKQGDPAFIAGAEFSCKDEQGKCHILGYGFDIENAELNALLEHSRSLRVQKLTARLEFLKEKYGFTFSDEEIRYLKSLDNPGKPHIGDFMVKHKYASSVGEAISLYIDKLDYKSEYILPEQAISAILTSGGIPVVAHLFKGSGSENLTDEEAEKRLHRLTGYGLKGIEAFYPVFSAAQQNAALSFADKYDLFVTAGSDYHGTRKDLKLGQTGFPEGAVLPVRTKRFLSHFGI